MSTSINRQETRLKDVQLILRDLLKVIKVVSMYPESNPLPQSLKRTFAERLVHLTGTYTGLKLSVNKDTLMLDDETVFADVTKEEALASLFFEAGISCLVFAEDLDVDQVYKFLDVIKNYQNNRKSGEDLVTQFWAASLPSISITTVEDIALAEYDGDFRVQEIVRASGPESSALPLGTERTEDYSSIFEREISLDDTGRGQASTSTPHVHLRPGTKVDESVLHPRQRASHDGPIDNALEMESVTLRVKQASDAMGYADIPVTAPPEDSSHIPNAALILNDEFKLSEEEEQLIRELMDEDAQFDMYESTIDLLKEMLHQEPEQAEFFETVTICEKIHGDFVETGRLIEAAHLLEFYRVFEEELHADHPTWAERLKDARLTAGSRQRLRILTDCLNQKPDTGMAELRRYLDHFGWEALNAIADMLGDLEHRNHRLALCDYLADRGRDNLDFVSKGIFDKRWFVVRNTVIILGRIGDDRALGYLSKAASHEDRRVRLELSNILQEAKSERAIEILGKLALDADREVRDGAIRSLVARRGQKAFTAISQIVNGNRFITLDRSEQQQLLSAYSALGGEYAVEYLEKMITQLNPFNDPARTFFRKAAFEALVVNKSEKAEKLLVNLSTSWVADVKRQAQAALRKRRELIYGGAHVGDRHA
jgi:HEAT repeat protein